MKYKYAILILIIFFTLVRFFIQPLQANWNEELYNPKPDSNDIDLPMPCGGKLTFRKVETEAEGLYGDQAVRLGDANVGRDRYKSNPVKRYIAGNFTSSSKGRRYLLIGKYEITQLQYAVIMQDASVECPKLDENSALPQVRINWFDAIEFSKRYTLWLHQQYKNDHSIPLPKKDSELGFIRLPTEVEWEFATRGGLAAKTLSDYQAKTFFSIAEANQYAWFAGSNSANGKLRQIGLLKPNLLGLYDVLGNADEIVFGLFHLSHHRAGHLHGETGGYVVRGGNYQDDEQHIYSARREEVSFYRSGKLRQSPSTGFRVVVASPVITNANVRKLADAWEQLSLTGTSEADFESNAPISRSNVEPLYQLSRLSEKTDDTALKKQLNELSVQLNAQKIKYDEQLNRAAREALRTAAILCQKLTDDSKILIGKQSLYNAYSCEFPTDSYITKCENLNFHKAIRVMSFNKKLFADAVINLSSFGLDIVSKQKELWVQEIISKEFTHMKPYPDIIYPYLEQYVITKRMQTEKWYQGCKNIRH